MNNDELDRLVFFIFDDRWSKRAIAWLTRNATNTELGYDIPGWRGRAVGWLDDFAFWRCEHAWRRRTP